MSKFSGDILGQLSSDVSDCALIEVVKAETPSNVVTEHEIRRAVQDPTDRDYHVIVQDDVNIFIEGDVYVALDFKYMLFPMWFTESLPYLDCTSLEEFKKYKDKGKNVYRVTTEQERAFRIVPCCKVKQVK